jgi:hypothetical protein
VTACFELYLIGELCISVCLARWVTIVLTRPNAPAAIALGW